MMWGRIVVGVVWAVGLVACGGGGDARDGAGTEGGSTEAATVDDASDVPTGTDAGPGPCPMTEPMSFMRCEGDGLYCTYPSTCVPCSNRPSDYVRIMHFCLCRNGSWQCGNPNNNYCGQLDPRLYYDPACTQRCFPSTGCVRDAGAD